MQLLAIAKEQIHVIVNAFVHLACVQTSPISFGKVPFPRATKEIGDVCTQVIVHLEYKQILIV